ncbi:MAG: hypothetical protein HS130_00850 [Deltaproteobacteria bacterium]|nr:hypothetical protein [Deltaproteobacteria bacterium]MCL4873865.1 hypothetical protein [bacterium]
MESVYPVILSVFMALLIAVVQFLGKVMKGEEFSPGKLVRTGIVGLVVGAAAGLGGVEVTLDNFVMLAAANAGTVVAAESIIKFLLRLAGINIIFLLALMLALPATSCMAKEVMRLEWAPVTTAVDGTPIPPEVVVLYTAYCGIAPTVFGTTFDIGSAADVRLNDVLNAYGDGKYHCALTARAEGWSESDFSPTVSIIKKQGTYHDADAMGAPGWLRLR